MTIQKKLKTMNKEELILVINDLLKYNSENRKYLNLRLSDEIDFKKLSEESKIKIKNCFSDFKADIRRSKKILSDYNKLNPPIDLYLDLFLFYLEYGIKYGQHRDMYSSFYYSFEIMFEKFLDLIKNDSILVSKYKSKLEKIVDNSQPGYGHYDTLSELMEVIK